MHRTGIEPVPSPFSIFWEGDILNRYTNGALNYSVGNVNKDTC